jgi:hypothetical protein
MLSCCINCFFRLIRIYNRLFYIEIPKPKISTSKLPWLWIGVELTNGKIETMTDLVNNSIEYGDVITPEFLEKLTNIKNAKRWIYLKSTTLNEEEIPAEGLVIEDDSN